MADRRSARDRRIKVSQQGTDTLGREHASAAEMWDYELSEDPTSENGWYGKAIAYWEAVDATVDGVLGGFGHVSSDDLRESGELLRRLELSGLVKFDKEGSRAADCGAGIGRITEGLLMHRFSRVDVVEPVGSFIAKARESLGERTKGEFLQVGLQDFNPAPGSYDCIWVQWVIGHLTDDDCVAFFQRCVAGLKPKGVLVLKENVVEHGFVVDKDDSSLTRSDAFFRELFQRANISLVHCRQQVKFPKELFRVNMYALQAIARPN